MELNVARLGKKFHEFYETEKFAVIFIWTQNYPNTFSQPAHNLVLRDIFLTLISTLLTEFPSGLLIRAIRLHLYVLLLCSMPPTRSAYLNMQNKIPYFWKFFFHSRERYWEIKLHRLYFVNCNDRRIHIRSYETFHKVRSGQRREKLFPGMSYLLVFFFFCWNMKK